MGNITGFFGIIVFGCGLYVLYAGYQMIVNGEISKSILLGNNRDPRNCKNKAAYIQEAKPKVIVLGISAVVDGLVDYVNTSVTNLGVIAWVVLGIFLLVLIWYLISVSKLNKKYF